MYQINNEHRWEHRLMLTTTLCRSKPSLTRYVPVWVYIRMYLDLHVCVCVCTYSCTVYSEISAYVAVPCSYSVAYFDRNVAFEAPYRWASVNEVHISPALNRSSAIRRFEGNDAIEIRDGITFDFYTGLPHIILHEIFVSIIMCTAQSCNFGVFIFAGAD